MKARDRAIIADLERFRAMSRDDIADLHFRNVKAPASNANTVLTRLYRLGYIDRSTDYSPYVYFPAENAIKKNGQKVRHFLEIVRVYRDMCRLVRPSVFSVEAKYAKSLAEPDALAVWKGSPLFLEIQCSQYSTAQMAEKMLRYEALKESGIIAKEPWQPAGKPPVFPAILIITPTRYAVQSDSLTIMQAASIEEFLRGMNVRQSVSSPETSGIKIRIG